MKSGEWPPFLPRLPFIHEQHSRRFSAQTRSQRHKARQHSADGWSSRQRQDLFILLWRSCVLTSLSTSSTSFCSDLFSFSFCGVPRVQKRHHLHTHQLAVNLWGSSAVFSEDELILTFSEVFTRGGGGAKSRESRLWLGHLRSCIQPLQRMSGDYPEFSACLKAASA